MSSNGITPVQAKMLAILADGQFHRREELYTCLSDDLGPITNINAHVSQIRKRLRLYGEDIACERLGGQISYRHVRLRGPARQSS